MLVIMSKRRGRTKQRRVNSFNIITIININETPTKLTVQIEFRARCRRRREIEYTEFVRLRQVLALKIGEFVANFGVVLDDDDLRIRRVLTKVEH